MHDGLVSLGRILLSKRTHFLMAAAFKNSLVEHIFRCVWERNAAALADGSAAASSRDGRRDRVDSDEDDEDEEEDAAAASTKINSDAVKLSSEFLRVFLLEALNRAQMEAMVDDSPTIEPHHVEHILAQLLLDF